MVRRLVTFVAVWLLLAVIASGYFLVAGSGPRTTARALRDRGVLTTAVVTALSPGSDSVSYRFNTPDGVAHTDTDLAHGPDGDAHTLMSGQTIHVVYDPRHVETSCYCSATDIRKSAGAGSTVLAGVAIAFIVTALGGLLRLARRRPRGEEELVTEPADDDAWPV